jgi:hypothetical protein
VGRLHYPPIQQKVNVLNGLEKETVLAIYRERRALVHYHLQASPLLRITLSVVEGAALFRFSTAPQG